MRETAFDTIQPLEPLAALPARLRQAPSRVGAILSLLLLGPAILAPLVPLLMLAASAGDGDVLSLMWAKPLAVVQLLAAALLWAALFVAPLGGALSRLTRARTISIDAGRVCVTDEGLFGTRRWSADLASFRGLAHHVRATHSGTRHELILVHADPAKTLLVHVASRIPQSLIDSTAALLGVPEVPAGELYRLAARAPRLVRALAWRTAEA